jgi:hypothetical protein
MRLPEIPSFASHDYHARGPPPHGGRGLWGEIRALREMRPLTGGCGGIVHGS